MSIFIIKSNDDEAKRKVDFADEKIEKAASIEYLISRQVVTPLGDFRSFFSIIDRILKPCGGV